MMLLSGQCFGQDKAEEAPVKAKQVQSQASSVLLSFRLLRTGTGWLCSRQRDQRSVRRAGGSPYGAVTTVPGQSSPFCV